MTFQINGDPTFSEGCLSYSLSTFSTESYLNFIRQRFSEERLIYGIVIAEFRNLEYG